jgi:urease accessory protein
MDLAPQVGASLKVMEADSIKVRGGKPFIFTDLKKGVCLQEVIDFIIKNGFLTVKF